MDDEGQVIRRRDSRGRIIDHREHGDLVYAAGDATEAYEGRLERFHRHVLFNRPEYFVIIDDQRFVTVLWPFREGQPGHREATLVEAEGGIALRVGDDLVLWKDPAVDFRQRGRRDLDPTDGDQEGLFQVNGTGSCTAASTSVRSRAGW